MNEILFWTVSGAVDANDRTLWPPVVNPANLLLAIRTIVVTIASCDFAFVDKNYAGYLQSKGNCLDPWLLMRQLLAKSSRILQSVSGLLCEVNCKEKKRSYTSYHNVYYSQHFYFQDMSSLITSVTFFIFVTSFTWTLWVLNLALPSGNIYVPWQEVLVDAMFFKIDMKISLIQWESVKHDWSYWLLLTESFSASPPAAHNML